MIEQILKTIADKAHEDILIVGKGPSVDRIDFSSLDPMIVINVNDSELVFPGDISIFHHGWVLDIFDDHPPKCKLYISDKQIPGSASHCPAEYIPYNPNTAELIIHRFFNEPFAIEQATVISALRIANEIAKAAKERKNVYLVGFDFSTKDGFTSKIPDSSHHADAGYLERVISSQEQFLEMLIAVKEKLSINILHIGDKPYSFYSTDAFNTLKSLDSKNIPSPPTKSSSHDEFEYGVKIVAEITTNHFGDIGRLKSMIVASKEAGADYIKLQKRNVDSFYPEKQLNAQYNSPFGDTFREYRHGIELKKEHFDMVAELCEKLGIGWFVSVLDIPSYEFILPYDPDLIKLPSTISEHKDLLSTVGKNFTKDIVISTGLTTPEYEEFVLETITSPRAIYLLQCTSSYPTMDEKAQIGVVRYYYRLSQDNPRIIPGLSSHDIGSLCSMMAVAAGAKMIEKHVKFGNVAWSHFDEVAVDLVNGDFKNFVSDVRRAERIVGSERKEIHEEEHHKYWLKP